METAQRAVLFADVTDSTRIYESLGDAVALAVINGLFGHLEKIVAKFTGSVVKTLGDGLVCTFEDPDDGFRAACEMQASVTALAQRASNRLQIKIGFTYGPVILSKGDVFGDTMNVCARLVTLANPEQILTSGQTVEALSPGLRTRCRELFPTRIKGKADEVPVSDVIWRYDPAVTETNLTRAQLAPDVQMALKLIYRANIFVVSRTRPALQLGREDDNDIVVVSLFTSRMHARVQARDGHFVLTDLSTNGTFVLVDEHSSEVHLRREEAVLGGRGWIGLGKSAAKHGDHSVRYTLQPEIA
ncbi:MAG: adenylate/guanylate cyclase domain-containing protein [Candidatus Parcubacteria bacterium]|nr:adenylate/guanylate cyclase domain-containing protein [Burkholderiales bacterium]